MPGFAYLTLPALQLNAIATLSNVSANLTATVEMTLPVPRVSASASFGAEVAMTLPVPVLQASGFVSSAAHVAMRLPTPSLLSEAKGGNVADVAMTLPMPRMQVSDGNAIALTLPTPQLSIDTRPGQVGRVAMVLPTPKVSITADVPFVGVVAMTLPIMRVQMEASAGATARVTMALNRLAMSAEGFTGRVANVELTLPMLQMTSVGYGPMVGTVHLTLPMLTLRTVANSTGDTPAKPDGDVLPSIVMHTETGALTEYDNFPFNSYAAFNGAYLGACAEGLFVLSGATDNQAKIVAAARAGITDFGTSYLKRVDRAYVGYRTDGNLYVRVFTDETSARDYLLAASGRAGLHGNHFRIGKGLRARYWQFEIGNLEGADFDLNVIELKPTQLRRRIGGGDA